MSSTHISMLVSVGAIEIESEDCEVCEGSGGVIGINVTGQEIEDLCAFCDGTGRMEWVGD